MQHSSLLLKPLSTATIIIPRVRGPPLRKSCLGCRGRSEEGQENKTAAPFFSTCAVPRRKRVTSVPLSLLTLSTRKCLISWVFLRKYFLPRDPPLWPPQTPRCPPLLSTVPIKLFGYLRFGSTSCISHLRFGSTSFGSHFG